MYLLTKLTAMLHTINIQVDEPQSRCSKCKSLKQENKRLRRMQRWLQVQLEGLKRENQQLRQTNAFSQNLLQSSKKQLELMEEKESELRNLVPLLQQATTLIECTSVARNGLSANFNHLEEFFHSFSNPPGLQESIATEQLVRQDSPSSGYHHIRQISIETQASSRLSSEVSDCEMELEQLSLLNEQTLKELHELTTKITATYPPIDSHHHSPSNGVSSHHETSGIGQHPPTDTYTKPAWPVAKFDDGYDHLSGTGKHKESKDRTNSKENTHSRSMQGYSWHIRKHWVDVGCVYTRTLHVQMTIASYYLSVSCKDLSHIDIACAEIWLLILSIIKKWHCIPYR